MIISKEFFVYPQLNDYIIDEIFLNCYRNEEISKNEVEEVQSAHASKQFLFK